jgi:hypothetical protein
MKLSLAEIIDNACKKTSKQEKVDYLRENNSAPLRTILNVMYNKNLVVLLPDVPPPWKKNAYVGVEGMLFKEARRLRIFIKGGGYDNIDQVKREDLFIKLLEDIDNNDAELLVKMIAQKPLKGLSRAVVAESFPELNIQIEEK